ncbi:amidohydrolase family protein [Luteococcus sp. OSA5]|uniref:amidohydrolase family protein n=1 Tax=Luteococcus sp. OSA5 TaxID=3401630 RepID=UPI003B431C40
MHTTQSLTLSRRTLLGAAAVTGTAAVVGNSPQASAAPPAASTRFASATDFAVAVSPDGKQLAVDHLGVLWIVPASGGIARRLTSDFSDIAQPNWSPDGKRIAFQSYRDGNFHIWSCTPDGTDLRQHTQGPFDHREPRFSPDGKTIAYSTDQGGSYNIGLLDVASGKTRLLVMDAQDAYEPAWSPDGKRIAYVVENTQVHEVTVHSGQRRTLATLEPEQVAHHPAYLPDGKEVAFHLFADGKNSLQLTDGAALVSGEEVFPLPASFLPDGTFYYAAGGRIRRRRLSGSDAATIGFTAAVKPVQPNYRRSVRRFDAPGRFPVVGIGSPVLSRDGKQIAFCALNDVYLMPVDGKAKPLFQEPWWFSHPDFSPSGKELVYASDRSGTMNLWIRDLASGADRQLTAFTDMAAVSCRWSPDGKEIAFLDQDGGLWVADATTGSSQLVFDATFEPGRPTWSPDGKLIALAAVKPYTKRFREGLSTILVVDRATGEGSYHEVAPHRSLQTRGDDGPIWAPDGSSMLFAMANRAWTLPVDEAGKPTGKPRRVNDELTDALSWGADSQTFLYLSGERLRLSRRGRVRTLSTALTWSNHRGTEKAYVIHAGQLWDGESKTVRRNVDVVVRGQRIVAVEPHRKRPGMTVVDASKRFVMPGLIDAHHHREMQGYEYGSRQGALWLSMGVTMTRSPGSPAFHMVHEREAVQSGRRLAPRYLATGEAIDGSRIYYNFMRPTTSTGQVREEMRRARELDYDLIKCYVRLRTEDHRRVIADAHRAGMHVTSHYHYPALAFGGDWTEHIGATNRFGYSRTITNVGTGYEDVIKPFVDAQMARTPTLFDSSILYREDDSLVSDERITRLNPVWRKAALDRTVEEARAGDPTPTLTKLENQVAQVKAMIRAGGVVTSGTDAPIDHLAISLHMNLRAMVKFGVSTLDALRSVTSVTGKVLRQPIGRVAKGMYADLLIVDGNPLENIDDLANVNAVVTAGRHLTRAEIMAPFPSPTATDRRQPVKGTSVAAASGAKTSRVTAKQGDQQVRPRVPKHGSAQDQWWNSPQELAEARRQCCREH